MSQYTHLTITEREDIMILHKAGHSIGYIASVLNRSKSTISRELKRVIRSTRGEGGRIVRQRHKTAMNTGEKIVYVKDY